ASTLVAQLKSSKRINKKSCRLLILFLCMRPVCPPSADSEYSNVSRIVTTGVFSNDLATTRKKQFHQYPALALQMQIKPVLDMRNTLLQPRARDDIAVTKTGKDNKLFPFTSLIVHGNRFFHRHTFVGVAV